MEIIYHTVRNNWRAGVAILILNKIDFKTTFFARGTFDGNESVSLPRSYNNHKYICT